MPGYRFTVRVPAFARPALSDGRPQIERRFQDKKVGEAWVADLKAKISKLKAGAQAQAIGIDRRNDITFTAAAGTWLSDRKVKPKTLSWYADFLRAHLVPFLGALRLSQLSKGAVDLYVQHREREGATAHSIVREVDILRFILNWGRRQGFLVDGGAWKVELPAVVRRVRRAFDPAKIEMFLAAATRPRDRAVLDVAGMTGMRGNELRAFHCSWIRWGERRIVIPADEEFAPKDREERSIPLFAELEQVLKGWLGDRREGLVFPPVRAANRWGKVKAVDLRCILRRVRRASRVPLHGIRDFRHHYLSLLGHRGVPAPIIMEVGGHEDLETSQGYIHAHPDYLKDAREALERGWSAGRNAGRPAGKTAGSEEE